MSSAAATVTNAPAGDPPPPAKGKKKLIVILVALALLVVLAGGGATLFVLKQRAAAAAEESGEDGAAAGAHAAGDKAEHAGGQCTQRRDAQDGKTALIVPQAGAVARAGDGSRQQRADGQREGGARDAHGARGTFAGVSCLHRGRAPSGACI